MNERLRTRAWLSRGLFDWVGYLVLVDQTIAFDDDSGERVFVARLDEIKASLPTLWPGIILRAADREYRMLFVNPYLSEGSVRSARFLKEPWRQAFHGSTPKPVDSVGL